MRNVRPEEEKFHCEPEDEWAAFDRLPSTLREAIRLAGCNYSAVECQMLLNRGVTIDEILKKIKLADRYVHTQAYGEKV